MSFMPVVPWRLGMGAALCLVGALGVKLPAADETAIRAALEKPIGSPDITLAETQKFVERRIAVLPRFDRRQEWESYASALRQRVLDEVVFRGAAASWRDAQTRVEWREELKPGDGYTIRKLRYEALPGMWIPALLYTPDGLSGKRAAAMNVNGHDGAGKAADYKQIRCINQVKRGMVVLNLEWLGMGQLSGADYSHARMNQLDLCGASGLAPFYLAMKRGLDILLSHENVDPQRIAVTGLSGGGWQTIVISSLDTRVTLSNPVAGYSSFRTRLSHFKDLGDSEQTPTDLGAIADYTHLTAMLAPRPALLTFCRQDDCCFEAPYALPPLLEAAEPVYALYEQPSRLKSHINSDPGTHNYGLDNRLAHYRMLGEFFFAGESFDPAEIPSEKEVQTADALRVELPEGNATFHSLARDLAQTLPRNSELPADIGAVGAWRSRRAQELRRLTRFADYVCASETVEKNDIGGVAVESKRFRIGDDWTVPAVVFEPKEAAATVLLVSEEGRAALASRTAELVAAGNRVIAFDPFYLGECRFTQRDYLFGLLVHTVGERVLGLQASQTAAIARWARQKYGHAVSLESKGPRSSLFCLVAMALESDAIGEASLAGSYGSLKEVIEQNLAVTSAPDLFCFGLLEEFDILQLSAIAAPRLLRFPSPGDRARSELAPLADWYGLLGSDHRPIGD